jgi:hypothetical protein
MRTWIVKNQHEARFGLRFEASRHVDAVTEYVVPIGHDVAEIDANSENRCAHLPAGRGRGSPSRVDLRGTAHCVDDTDQFHQQPVFGGLDNAAVMLSDLGGD